MPIVVNKEVHNYSSSGVINTGSTGGTGTPGGSPPQVQYNSGGTFAGDSMFTWDNTNKALVLGTGTPFNSTVDLQIGGSSASTIQSNIQNTSAGTSASGDWVATADTGTDTTNYIDMGINSSTYADAAYTSSGALDGYLYTNGGNLVEGTQTAGKVIKWHTGGTLAANVRATLSDTGLSLVTPLAIASGGTGSATQNFVDLTTSQSKNASLEVGSTVAPTHSLTVGQTGTGMAIYNTVDQTVNFERMVGAWSANTFSFRPTIGGTGLSRTVIVGSGVSIHTYSNNGAIVSTGTPSTAANLNMYNITGSGNNAASGVSTAFSVTPTYAQTVTAGYTAILANVTESSVGSGAKNLIDLQVAGASKAKIDNTGTLTLVGGLNVSYVAAALTTATTLTVTSKTIQDADATAATFAVTPPATTTAGIMFTITKIDASANAVTLVGTFNGNAAYSLSTQWKYITFVTTATSGSFRIVGNN
jgi:hypothetical protein